MLKKNLTIFKNVFVLGGSSEIAQEICIQLVKKGTERIHLVSRTPNKNKKFIRFITRNFNTSITNQKVDLLSEQYKCKPKIDFFDLYIIAAGYLGDSFLANNDNEEALKIAMVNYFSLLPWINSIASDQRISKPGSLWILSSIAGDIGRPSNYHYGAAKAALTIFSEGLINRCHQKPFKVRIIKTGLVYTRMSKGKAPKLLCINKVYFVKKIIKKLNQEGIEYIPFWWFFIIKLISILPRSLTSKL